MSEARDFKKFFASFVIIVWLVGIAILFSQERFEWAIFLSFAFAFSFIAYLTRAAIKGKILVPNDTGLLVGKNESHMTGGRARFVAISTAVMILIPIAIFMEENTLISNNFNLSTFVSVLLGIIVSPLWRIVIFSPGEQSEKSFLERMMDGGEKKNT